MAKLVRKIAWRFWALSLWLTIIELTVLCTIFRQSDHSFPICWLMQNTNLNSKTNSTFHNYTIHPHHTYFSFGIFALTKASFDIIMLHFCNMYSRGGQANNSIKQKLHFIDMSRKICKIKLCSMWNERIIEKCAWSLALSLTT